MIKPKRTDDFVPNRGFLALRVGRGGLRSDRANLGDVETVFGLILKQWHGLFLYREIARKAFVMLEGC